MGTLQYTIPLIEYQRFLKTQEQLQTMPKGHDGKEAGALIAELGCQLMDQVFTQLLSQLQARRSDPFFLSAQQTIQEIQSLLRKYTPWASGLVGNARLLPVAEHYLGLLSHDPVRGEAILRIALKPDLFQKAERSLQHAAQADTGQVHALIEVLIEVTELCLEHLMEQPKSLLKFNFVADKTLNGVITVTKAMAFKQLRKLGQVLQADELPLVARHLQQFMHPA